jgi:2-polyprenyl-6-methoxyphenol hydroxylase-like FAD-dependent oxidoreductase
MGEEMHDVLVVGAGPTGLVLALWLTKQGVKARIIDKSKGPGETSRAMAVQARTLELYRQLDMADAVVAAGHPNPGFNLWARGKRKAHIQLTEAGAGLTPYPYLLVYPQDQHERFLVDRLQALGVAVERQTELLSFEETGDQVSAKLRLPDGQEEICAARFLAGCDGAHSIARHQIGAGFEGGTYNHIFYVADVEVSGLNPPGETHISLDSADFVAVLSYGHDNQSRLIGIVSDEGSAQSLTFDDVGHKAISSLGLTIEKVNWFSTYHVHHRVTDHFRKGRAFLLGDAAHVHSPAGGQGMNTGISDAINLAWKLAAVVKGRAPDALLDSYEIERRAFALKLVDTTDRAFSFVTAGGDFASFVRTRIAPVFASVAYSFEFVQEFVFKVISQITVNYHDGPLSEGAAGKVRGGDRLPWAGADADNFAPLSAIVWQLHVYGAAGVELRKWCDQNDIALHVFDWRPQHEKAGLARDAAYLLRPDSYVGMADLQASPAALTRYIEAHGFAKSR